MSQINNPIWLTFGGDPVQGMAPTPLVLREGALTPSRSAMVQHAYHLYRLSRGVSVTEYCVSERVLEDGTRVRMESAWGRDRVFVWAPKEEGEDTEIPHGFVVVSTWNDPKFYAKQFERSEKKTFLGMAVPQAKGGITGYSAVHDYDKDGFLIEPLVRTDSGKIVWDWAPHAGVGVGGTYVFPVNPDVTGFVGEMEHLNGFHHGPAHIVSDAKILSASGKVVAVLESEPNIRLDGADSVEVLCGAADSDGDGVALQAMRSAVLSATANICQFVFWSTVFRRMSLPSASEATYEAATVQGSLTRKVCKFRTPLRADKVILNEWISKLNEPVSNDLLYIWWNHTEPGSMSGSGPAGNFSCGVTRRAYPATSIIETDSAHGSRYKTELDQKRLTHVLALGGSQGINYLDIENSVAYTDDEFFRAGTAEARDSRVWPELDSFGILRKDIGRIDSRYSRTASPVLKLVCSEQPWPAVNLFEGDVNGRLSGRVHTNTEYRFGRFAAFFPYKWVTTIISVNESELEPNNLKPLYMADYDEWATGITPNGQTIGDRVPTTETTEERPSTAGAYKFISRYIIDYDQRAQFYAAIRVEVECSGAEWKENQSIYLGWQSPVGQPTYRARIFFDVNWGGTTVSKLLTEAGCVRSPFEFERFERVNPYYWPSPIGDDRPMIFWLPPKIYPDERLISQLKNIPVHQGVNPHLVSQDNWITDNPDPKKTIWSKTGVEFSYITADGEEIPTRKMTRGMLYARSFKLSDFPDALWLLSETKCDAPEGGSQPPLGEPKPMWFYMPQLGDDIANKKFRIEMRDGKLYTWTDDLPAKDGMVRPSDPYDREVKLYSV